MTDDQQMPAARHAVPPSAPATRGHRGALALVCLAPIWGYGWVAMKVSLAYSQPFWFSAVRVVLSAVCLLVVMVVTRRPLRPPAPRWMLAVGLLQTTGFVGLVTWALASAGAGKTSVLTYTMPFWLLLLAWLFLRERLQGTQWLAVALAVAGMVLVIAPWRLHSAGTSLLTIAGGLSWAGSALVVKLLQRRQHVDLLSLTTWQMIFGAVPLIVIAALVHEHGPHWTLAFVASLSYAVVMANVVAWLLWLYALRALSAGAAGLGTLAIPVLGVLAAWLQLGERPPLVQGIGMIAIVAGLAILAVGGAIAGRRQAGPGDDEPLVRPLTD